MANKTKTIEKTNSFLGKSCSMRQISSKSHSVVIMGVFHCTWMRNLGSKINHYYFTKGYKGSTLTMCQNLDELKSYRCYTHLPLKYSYYGTGHVLYKGYLFYNQEETNYLIVHNLETQQASRIKAPDDAACCNLMHDSLYNVKHSGFFDFEVDENGLWLIYKRAAHFSANLTQNNHDADDYSSFDYESGNQHTFIVAKIDEKKLNRLAIEKKYQVRVDDAENLWNMFIVCGQLYALKNTYKNPAQIQRLCDFSMGGDACSNDYELNSTISNKNVFNISISSRQITSLNYDPDNKLLHMVDGGSFVYYKSEL